MVERLRGNRFSFDPAEFHKIMGALPDGAGSFSFTYTDDGLYVLSQRTIDRLTANAWNNDGDCTLCGDYVWGGGNCTKGCPADSFNMARMGKPGKPLTPRQARDELVGNDHEEELLEREASDKQGGET